MNLYLGSKKKKLYLTKNFYSCAKFAVKCTGITINNNLGLSFMSAFLSCVGMQSTIIATVTPENCTEKVVWTSSDNSVATVDGGVVTVTGNGNCVITATCGVYSVTCPVTVKGK